MVILLEDCLTSHNQVEKAFSVYTSLITWSACCDDCLQFIVSDRNLSFFIKCPKVSIGFY